MNKRLPNSVKERNFKKQKAKKRTSSPLELDGAYEISRIFRQKNWIAFNGYESIYKRYLDTIGKLNPDQQRLFIDLSERIYWKFDYTNVR